MIRSFDLTPLDRAVQDAASDLEAASGPRKLPLKTACPWLPPDKPIPEQATGVNPSPWSTWMISA